METGEQQDALSILLREKIRRGGPLTFASFMEHCLYHETLGYYASGKVRIGTRGDFFTSSSVHQLFGRLLATQILEMAEILGDKERFTIREWGAGEGLLAHDLLNAISAEKSQAFGRFRYEIVERSPALRKRQGALLARLEDRGRSDIEVVWPDSGNLPPMSGCVLSNELIDAFPVHRARSTGRDLVEQFVGYRNGRFCWVEGDPSTPDLVDFLDQYGVELAENQLVEINLEAARWIRGVAENLNRGFVITIDYGYEAPDLYASERRGGTLAAYDRHRRCDDFLSHPGSRDLTSHVNFSALIRAGEQCSLTTAGFVPQYRFLISLAAGKILQEMEETAKRKKGTVDRLALKTLVDPEGLGGTHKVLIQHREVENPLLTGLGRMTPD